MEPVPLERKMLSVQRSKLHEHDMNASWSEVQQPRHVHVHYQPVSLGLHTAIYVPTQLHVHAELADEC